ncbi:hypothetical protein DXG01_004868 [Tephrocybe rancida]|nr:hypothetical protein DXG01_004868 [Tephrocybe rancida]
MDEINIDDVYGAALAGVILNAWVFGLICVLSYEYFVNFPKDRLSTKLLHCHYRFLQLFNAIIVSKMVYYYLVTSFGKFEVLSVSTWEWPLYTGLSSIAAFSVQAYYARRTYLLIKSRLLFGVILSLAVLQLGFGLATMSKAYQLKYFVKYTSVEWTVVGWLCCSAACDIIVAVAQVVYLHRHRSGISKSNRLIKILTLYIMSTGLLTSIFAILELTTFASLGPNFVHVFLSIAMGAVYVVSLLANLDARRTLRTVGGDGMTGLDTIHISRDLSFKINVEKRKFIDTENVVGSLPSTTTQVSDLPGLHSHPSFGDLNTEHELSGRQTV